MNYTSEFKKLGPDRFEFKTASLVVTRRHPRREGVVGGAAQVYEDEQGHILGYTLSDVRQIALARMHAPARADKGEDGTIELKIV